MLLARNGFAVADLAPFQAEAGHALSCAICDAQALQPRGPCSDAQCMRSPVSGLAEGGCLRSENQPTGQNARFGVLLHQGLLAFRLVVDMEETP